MNIAILGATGWIGGHIVNEALVRGHHVIALARNPDKISAADAEVRSFDLLDPNADLAGAVTGADAVISAIGGRAQGRYDIVVSTARRLLDELPKVGIDRLLWVGGAASLEVSPGVQLITLPEFPEEYKAEATPMIQVLEIFRSTQSPLNWTFVSPAADIFPGERQAPYRIGGDQLLVDKKGKSRISVSDYAAAMIDELESGRHPRQRIGVAY